MAELSTQHDPADLEAVPFSGRFVLGMVLLTIMTLVLNAIAVLLLFSGWAVDWTGRSSAAIPASLPPMTILPSTTVLWKDEVWSAGLPGTQPMMLINSMYGPTTVRLVAFSTVTGKPRQTNITLPRVPLGLIVVDDELLCVCENVVYRIQNGQAFPRYPSRSLVRPSRPFLYKGRLAVFETNTGQLLTDSNLLVWQEGEWVEESLDDVSRTGFATNIQNYDIRVLGDKNGLYFLATGMATSVGAVDAGTAKWKPFPMALDWQTTWEVVRIGDALWAFSHSLGTTSPLIDQYRFKNGTWIRMPTSFPPNVCSFGIASGDSPYLVTDNWHLLSWNGSSFQRVTTGPPLSERLREVISVAARIFGYLLVNAFLVLGTARLMRKHRNPQYLYGKRTVTQASVLRRAVARGIDLLITVFPPAFWLAVFLNDEMHQQMRQRPFMISSDSTIALSFLSLFGIWIGLLLVLSVMEGLWGYTPGKWLLRIQALRTTLRPCGVLRAFSRELLLYVDSILLVTWLPGVLLIAFTSRWQRLGDLASDTVVVRDSRRN